MPAERTGLFVPTGAAANLETLAEALEEESGITEATVEKWTRRTMIAVTAEESAASADDADDVLAAAIASVGGLIQAPGTSYVDVEQPE